MTRHLKVRIDDELALAVDASAKRRGVSISDAVRTILAERTQEETSGHASPGSLQAAVFTNLIVSELAVALITSILPNGGRDAAELFESAAEEARRHLQRVELILEEGR